MNQTISLSVRVSREIADDIDRLAKATDRPRSWVLEQAVKSYLEAQAWQIERIEEGMAALDRGEHVTHEDVAEWLSSWGTAAEREPPK